MKKLITLAAVAALFGGAALYLNSNSKPSGNGLNGRKVLPAFKVADVAKITVGDKLALSAGEKGWTIDSWRGYPASREKIAENLLKLQDLKVGQVARGESLKDAPSIVVADGAGKTLASLPLGRKHMRVPKGEAAMYGGYPDGRYVGFEGQTVLVTDSLDAFDAGPKSWCETKIVDEPWISFDDLADEALTEADFGFATGVVARVTIAGDTNRTVTVGAALKDSSKRYLKLDNADWVYVVPSYSVEKLLPKPAIDEKKAEDDGAVNVSTDK